MTKRNQQKVIVAGGTSGIGLSLAIMLQEEGADVTVFGRNPSKLASINKDFPGIHAVQLDAADRSALDKFFEKEKAFDHLVLALSGARGGGAFTSLDLNEVRAGYEQKFWPQLNTLQAALPYLNKKGSVTFISAASAGGNMPGTAGLAAINGALEMMVPILSAELKPLRVNAVSPGVIDTPWWDFLPADARAQTFSEFSKKVAVGRIGRPEEVASAIRCIIDTEYINGTILSCNGGLH